MQIFMFLVVNEHDINMRNKNILHKMSKLKFESVKNSFYFLGTNLYNPPREQSEKGIPILKRK